MINISYIDNATQILENILRNFPPIFDNIFSTYYLHYIEISTNVEKIEGKCFFFLTFMNEVIYVYYRSSGNVYMR